MLRWWIFIKERFEPFSHLLMISALFFANHSLASSILFGLKTDGITEPFRLPVSLLITLLFFFHLRLFDELKDYKTDLDVNKDRPLPRGLIPLKEYKIVMAAVILLELGLAAAVYDRYAVISLGVAILYSLLMFKEFFVGDWIRPKMELYAVSHTFVSGFVALFIALSTVGAHPSQIPLSFTLIFGLNWMIFNVFEFARKTFAPSEERPGVESYSSRWGLAGGVAWTLIFVLLALSLIYRLNTGLLGWSNTTIFALIAVSAAVWVGGGMLIALKSAGSAKVFRLISALYLVVFNLILAVGSLL